MTNNNEEIKDPREEGVDGLSGVRIDDFVEDSKKDLNIKDNNKNNNPVSNYNAAYNELRKQYQDLFNYDTQSYSTGAPNKRWGESRFDDAALPTSLTSNIGELRAERQSDVGKVTNGLLKMGVLTGTTFLNGTLGMLSGIGAAVSGDNYWNNAFQDAMDQINQWSERALPNYYTQDEIDNPLALRNVFSGNFIGDRFLKNLGFTIGAMASATTWNLLIPGGGIVAGLAKTLIGTGLSAVNEGSIEAYNAAKEFRSAQYQLAQEDFSNKMNALNEWYEQNKTDTLHPVLDMEGRVTGYSNVEAEAYDNAKEQLVNDYNLLIERIDKDATSVGNKVLGHNIPLLMASNLLEFGKFLGGFQTTRNMVSQAFKGKGVLNSVKKNIYEGFEEGSQADISSAASYRYAKDIENFIANGFDEDTKEDVLNWTDAYARAISENLQSQDVWTERLIGGLTGGVGMVTVGRQNTQQSAFIGKGKPIGWSGGILGEIMANRDNLQRKSSADEKVTKFLNDSKKTQRLIDTLTRAVNIQEKKNNALIANSKFDYENANTEEDFNIISYFADSGRLNELKSMVSKTLDITDEDSYNALVNQLSVKNEDGSYNTSPFTDNSGNIISFEDGKNKIEKYRKELNDNIDLYTKVRSEIDAFHGDRLSDNQLMELTWIRFNIENLSKRGESMSDSLKEYIKNKSEYLSSKISELSKSQIKPEAGKINKSNEVRNQIDDLSFEKSLIDGMLTMKSRDLINSTKNIALLNAVLEQDDDFNKNNNLNVSELRNTANDLIDIIKLRKKYNDKLTEYLANPEKIDSDTNKKINKINKAKEAKKISTLSSKLKDAKSYDEVKVLLSDNKIDKDTAFNALEEAKDNDFVKQYKALNVNLENVRNELANYAKDQAVLDDANKILDDIKENGKSAESLYDKLSGFYIDYDKFRNNDNENDSNNIEQARKRLESASSLIHSVLDKLYGDEEEDKDAIQGNVSDFVGANDESEVKTVTEKPVVNEDGERLVLDDNGVNDFEPDEFPLSENNYSAESDKEINDSDGNGKASGSGVRSTWQQTTGQYDYKELKENHRAVEKVGYPIVDYLKSKDAYYFVRNKLQKHLIEAKDKNIYFGTDPEYVYEADQNKNYPTTIFMYVKLDNGEYQVIGDLPLSKSYANKFQGMPEFMSDIISEYNSWLENKDNDIFISKKYISNITNINPGYIFPQDSDIDLNQVAVNGLENSSIFVVIRNQSIAIGNELSSREADNILFRSKFNDMNGASFIAAPNAKFGEKNGRTLFLIKPKIVSTEYFTDNAKNNAILKSLRNAITELFTSRLISLKSSANAFNKIRAFIQLGQFDFHINEQSFRLYTKDGSTNAGRISFNDSLGNPKTEEEFFNDFCNLMNSLGVRFRVNKNLINSGNYNKAYIDSNILSVHVNTLDTISPWFEIEPAKTIESVNEVSNTERVGADSFDTPVKVETEIVTKSDDDSLLGMVDDLLRMDSDDYTEDDRSRQKEIIKEASKEEYKRDETSTAANQINQDSTIQNPSLNDSKRIAKIKYLASISSISEEQLSTFTNEQLLSIEEQINNCYL